MSDDKKRVVIKIGTSILTGLKRISQQGKERSVVTEGSLPSIVKGVGTLCSQGAEVLLVTSGAIGAGIARLGWTSRPEEIRKKQAAAAIGQVSLMQTYLRLFEAHKINVAQVLLTRGDFEDRRRYLNARATLLTLLELGVVPIINENDTVAVDEIQFGDNDRLAALVASKIDADLLIMLTDVEGLCHLTGKDGKGEFKNVIPLVAKITPEIEKLALKNSRDRMGTGGMASKIDAAKIATSSGVTMVIANGCRPGVIEDIFRGKSVGTKFVPTQSLSAKDRWILFGAIPKGKIWVDPGAARALKEMNRSLLAAGIVKVQGSFSKGDSVSILNHSDEEFGRGIISFSSSEIEKIKGKKSDEISEILNRSTKSFEVVHRNSLVLLI